MDLETKPDNLDQDVWDFIQTEWWESATAHEITGLILYDRRQLCPFDVFHEAIEKSLGRPVWTHEFGMNWKGLIAEYEGGDSPSFDEIVDLIPASKRIVVRL